MDESATTTMEEAVTTGEKRSHGTMMEEVTSGTDGSTNQGAVVVCRAVCLFILWEMFKKAGLDEWKFPTSGRQDVLPTFSQRDNYGYWWHGVLNWLDSLYTSAARNGAYLRSSDTFSEENAASNAKTWMCKIFHPTAPLDDEVRHRDCFIPKEIDYVEGEYTKYVYNRFAPGVSGKDNHYYVGDRRMDELWAVQYYMVVKQMLEDSGLSSEEAEYITFFGLLDVVSIHCGLPKNYDTGLTAEAFHVPTITERPELDELPDYLTSKEF